MNYDIVCNYINYKGDDCILLLDNTCCDCLWIINMDEKNVTKLENICVIDDFLYDIDKNKFDEVIINKKFFNDLNLYIDDYKEDYEDFNFDRFKKEVTVV